MHNVLFPAGDPANPAVAIEAFALNPGDTRFVDVMAQGPDSPHLWIWHTVVPHSDVKIPAQHYRLTIGVTANGISPIKKNFETIKNGHFWDMRAIDD